MSRPLTLASLLLACSWPGLSAAASPAPAANPSRPNIILVLTDDQGWGDVGAFFQNARRAGGERASFATPQLDRLAAEGARLTHHYCAAPVCAPSRASLLLGVHQGHANVRDNQFDQALENNHTLATVLRQAGYATAAIGKWGLHGQSNRDPNGADPAAPAHPLNRGFDSFYGYLRHIDGHEHYPKEAPYFGAKARLRGAPQVWDGRTDVTAGLDRCYTTDLFTARAKKFIADHAAATPERPFFLYLAYDTPHAALELPTQAYPDGGGRRGGLQWLGAAGRMINTAAGDVDSWTHPDYADATAAGEPWPDAARRYATAIRRIDDAIGDLVQLLRDLRIDDRTLLVFTSDNGPSDESYLPSGEFAPTFFASFGPFDGIKRDLWEGGLRVPAIARWPGVIPAGRIVEQPSAQWDWLPTFAAAAGVPAPARADGVSLLPLLTGHGTPPRRDALVFEYAVAGRMPDYAAFEPARRDRPRNQMQAVRLGDLVGVRYDVRSDATPFEIYDVVRDPKQTKNLARDPAYAPMQAELRAAALRSRRPDATAPRPYDAALVPALAEDTGATTAGLAWRAYAGDFPWVPNFAALTPVASGRAPRPEASGAEMAGATAVQFTGWLKVPANGDYTFHLVSDAPSLLRLHAATVIDADFGYVAGTEKSAMIRLQAGRHPFRLATLCARPGAPALRLEWSGPGFARRPIADAAFFCPTRETAASTAP